eukprot:92817-Pelagomonas_calceolata.AAC.4
MQQSNPKDTARVLWLHASSFSFPISFPLLRLLCFDCGTTLAQVQRCCAKQWASVHRLQDIKKNYAFTELCPSQSHN